MGDLAVGVVGAVIAEIAGGAREVQKQKKTRNDLKKTCAECHYHAVLSRSKIDDFTMLRLAHINRFGAGDDVPLDVLSGMLAYARTAGKTKELEPSIARGERRIDFLCYRSAGHVRKTASDELGGVHEMSDEELLLNISRLAPPACVERVDIQDDELNYDIAPIRSELFCEVGPCVS